MIGKLLSAATKVATLPLDVVNAGADILVGGDGTKASRQQNVEVSPLQQLEEVRDEIADNFETMDD